METGKLDQYINLRLPSLPTYVNKHLLGPALDQAPQQHTEHKVNPVKVS